MSKINIKISSPKGTPEEEIIFVIEKPEVSRVKMRKVDVEREIASIDEQTTNIAKRKVELEEIKSEMDKLL